MIRKLAGSAARLAPALLASTLLGCGATRPISPVEDPLEQPELIQVPTLTDFEAEQSGNSEATFSPQLPTVETGPLDPVAAGCTQADAGLAAVAERFARYRLTHGGLMPNDELMFELRRFGVPYVWPITLTFSTGTQGDEAQVAVQSWLDTLPPYQARRCGVAQVAVERDQQLVAAVVTDALADVRPIPRRARVGQWLPLDVQLHVPAAGVAIVALGPTGLPFNLPASLSDTGHIRAQLPLQKAGRWLFQVLPTLEEGPRPVAEVEVFVDRPLPTVFQLEAVPGETAFVENAPSAEAPAAGLFAMLNAARKSEGLSPLRLNPGLSRLAHDHALAMQARGQVSHDAGDGDPGSRLAELAARPSVVGENIARATSVRAAHRALWQSPSHRRSLLHPEFTQVGVGVARGAQGEVWVCELFVDRM